jgi:hypothetical protein
MHDCFISWIDAFLLACAGCYVACKHIGRLGCICVVTGFGLLSKLCPKNILCGQFSTLAQSEYHPLENGTQGKHIALLFWDNTPVGSDDKKQSKGFLE